MNKIRAWMMMVTAWGCTWLTIAALLLFAGLDRGAMFAAEGAYVAFLVTIVSGAGVTVFAALRGLVDRRVARAERGILEEPQG